MYNFKIRNIVVWESQSARLGEAQEYRILNKWWGRIMMMSQTAEE